MWENARKIPCTERPRGLSYFPEGWTYFRDWRWLRWFLLSLAPFVLSLTVGVWRKQIIPLALIAAMGTVVATIIFLVLVTGATSSNWGTYFRDQEPFYYWRDVAITIVCYVALATAGCVAVFSF
jgi:hypothetical protein